MKPKVLITSPIRNREDLLPYYFQSLLNVDYPKNKLGFYFLLNDSFDNSERILIDFKKYCRDKNIDCSYHVMNLKNSTGWSRDRNNKYSFFNLSVLRNAVIGRFLATEEYEYMLSVDTDIIIKSDTINKLLEADKDVCAGLIRNDYHFNKTSPLGHYYNVLRNDRGKINHIRKIGKGVLPCDVTGAVILIKRKVLEDGAKYSYHSRGEDFSFCLSAKEKGYNIYFNADAVCDHIMTNSQLENLEKEMCVNWK